MENESPDNEENKPIRVVTCVCCLIQEEISDSYAIMNPHICDDCYRDLLEGEITL